MSKEEGLKKSKIDTVITYLLSTLSLVMLFSRLFLVTPYDVLGESMKPTLEDGDRLIMKDRAKINKGDIVVIESPTNKDEMFIKRVVAKGGDEVLIKEGKVYVNGKLIEDKESYGYTEVFGLKGDEEEFTVEVPDGEVFVLGDNRENSMDSRVFGTVKEDTVKGEYWCRLLPLDRLGCN